MLIHYLEQLLLETMKILSVKIKTDNIRWWRILCEYFISSNDPLNPQVTIPVHLTVIGQPDLVAHRLFEFWTSLRWLSRNGYS